MKNGGIVPKVLDPRLMAIPIPCNNCMECRKQRAHEWRVRLHEDIKHYRNAVFVTLTLNTKSLIALATEIQEQDKTIYGYKLDNAIAKLAVKRWRERWRRKHKTSPRHWLVTELGHGTTEHIHLHGFIWTTDRKEIERTWQYGFLWLGEYVNDKTVSYCVKYVMKQDERHKHYKPIVLTSPGIGRKYTNTLPAQDNRYKNKDTREYYKTAQGLKLKLPRYFRNKLYTDQEREQLWLNKVETGIKYVLGDPIDTKENDREYRRALYVARQKNARLGYGGAYSNPAQKEQEEQRRAQIQKKRLDTETGKP